MIAPRATMRLQFHRGFTFAQAAALAPYFASLGVSHLYASPIMTARPGSLHGYDTIDATQVNPELGGEAEFRRLVGELRRHELGLIVDIVPNHMAIGNGNAWWMDVLAHGSDSHYAKYFDIDWTPTAPRLRGKILLPILGRPYGEALAAGEITLQLSAARRPVVRYFDHELPLAAAAAGAVDAGSLAEFATASPDGRERLHRLLEQQHYRLAWWRCANDEINWRRFFDINDLAAIRVEDDEVFEAVHATLLRLYAEGLVDGVRVDHIDGLARPGEYCRRLRARLRALEDNRPPGCPAGPAYLVVEKILGRDEQLPVSWETDGTTGYDFMDEISALQHDGAGEQPLSDLWTQVSGRAAHFRSEEIKARREILQRSFSSQLEATLDALVEITQGDLAMRDISRSALRRCLSEILVHFPVYRIYAEVGRSSAADRAILSRAVSRAAKSCLPGDRWLVELLGNWLIGRPIRPAADSLQTIALTRFQQLSAPLSAKAVEDTAFYRYGRLLSRNDVGFDPSRFASSAEEFHARMQARGSTFPRALLATATHDHKRGEDVRARLAVLSEIADEWSAALRRWLAAGGDRPGGGAAPLPDA
ncbi:MAG: malto-oligosyltrehalose synthase, partial [Xanthobacteraceae bacterium]